APAESAPTTSETLRAEGAPRVEAPDTDVRGDDAPGAEVPGDGASSTATSERQSEPPRTAKRRSMPESTRSSPQPGHSSSAATSTALPADGTPGAAAS